MQKQVRGFRRGPCERGGPKPLRSHSEPSRGLRCKKATSAGETPGSRRCWKSPLPARCPLTADSTFARLLPLGTAGRTEVAPEGRLPAAPAFQEPGRMGRDTSVSPPPPASRICPTGHALPCALPRGCGGVEGGTLGTGISVLHPRLVTSEWALLSLGVCISLRSCCN